MALIVSAASGNFNAGATWVGGVVPTIGDEARASNGHTITITANATCDEVSNAGTGIFTINDGVALTANVTNKSATSSRTCLQFTASSPGQATIVGNITGGPQTDAVCVNNVSTGTLLINGNAIGGSVGTNSSQGVRNTTSGAITITGNVTGGGGNFAYGAVNMLGGTILITGNATGGSGSSAFGVRNEGNGTVTINGIATGGTANGAPGASSSAASTGTINVGRAKGNAYGPGNTTGIIAGPGVANGGLAFIEIREIEYGTNGMSPTSGAGIRLKKLNSNLAIFNYCDTAGSKTLIDATENAAMPAASNVRSGVSYASGALTGSCAVPAASSVAFGVPVDNTSGTAVLTPAAIRAELATELERIDTTISSRLSPSGTLATVTTLTNAPTVPSAAAIADEVRVELATELARIDAPISGAGNAPSAATVATAVRTELATELARVDAAVSTRLAGSAYTAPANSDIAAVKAKTDLLPASPAATGDIPTAAQNATAVWSKPANELTVADSIGERAKQQSTVAITGAQLAAALS